jgi:hypothetical protein
LEEDEKLIIFLATDFTNYHGFSFVSFDDSTVLERTGSEIEQKGKAQTCHSEVVHGLGLMAGIELGNGFDFYNEFPVNYKIGFIDADRDFLVGHWEFYFMFESNTAQEQLSFECGLVNGFKKSWSENFVDFHGSADHGEGLPFVEQVNHNSSEMIVCHRLHGVPLIFALIPHGL